jgi:hypothetical protein
MTLLSTFKSRPTYQPLQPAPGPGRHWLVLEAASLSEALQEQLDLAFAPVQGSLQTWCVGAQADARGQATPLADLSALAEAFSRNVPLVSDCLYVQGTEPFVWSVAQAAAKAGWTPQQWQLAHAGSLQRRVWCTHCHGFTEGVKTSIVACAGCGRQLLVRDHFSKRHGAFMGVMVDAEQPGLVPKAEEVFP